uniref:Uncharacterized protein n=1 Tax=Eutreptiella gymnastica TaxID=73025 RepID=A0A7S4D1D2_9EUGL
MPQSLWKKNGPGWRGLHDTLVIVLDFGDTGHHQSWSIWSMQGHSGLKKSLQKMKQKKRQMIGKMIQYPFWTSKTECYCSMPIHLRSLFVLTTTRKCEKCMMHQGARQE